MWTKALLVHSKLGLMSIPTVMLLLLLLLLLLSSSPAGPQLLLSNTPAGEVTAIPPITAVERKVYTTTITSRQRPPLNNFPHLENTAASDQFLFDLCVAGRLQQVSPRFWVISHELVTVDRNQKVTILTANHVDRAGGILCYYVLQTFTAQGKLHSPKPADDFSRIVRDFRRCAVAVAEATTVKI